LTGVLPGHGNVGCGGPRCGGAAEALLVLRATMEQDQVSMRCPLQSEGCVLRWACVYSVERFVPARVVDTWVGGSMSSGCRHLELQFPQGLFSTCSDAPSAHQRRLAKLRDHPNRYSGVLSSCPLLPFLPAFSGHGTGGVGARRTPRHAYLPTTSQALPGGLVMMASQQQQIIDTIFGMKRKLLRQDDSRYLRLCGVRSS
jgi:hypothetical protein